MASQLRILAKLRLSAVSALLLASLARADEALVTTPLGAVQGLILPDGSGRLFEGVPYAQPPARWRQSVPVAAWAPTTYDATFERPGCVQLCTEDEPPHICPSTTSEDCLYMNVWTPRLPADGSTPSWPVLLFIHGGNFHDGAAGGLDADGPLLYDGRMIANETGTIVVVIQYRLGALGFLYLGDARDGTTVSGNFGLADQVTAMAFVKANIAAFGGDAQRVTLIGQSAGAMSISAHMSRGATAGLYQGAVMLSNPHGEQYRDRDAALSIAGAFANFTGCGQALNLVLNATLMEECLQAKDAATILSAQMQAELYLLADLSAILQVVVAWSPTIGTAYLPLRPLEAFQSGNIVDVPYMIGTTANETVIFVYEVFNTSPGQYLNLSQVEYEVVAAALIGPEYAMESVAYYPWPNPLPTDYKVFSSTLLTDGLFLCPTRNATEALFVAQPFRKSKAYHWQYSHVLASSPNIWSSNFTECDNVVCHGSDLPEFWHPRRASIANYTASEEVLARTMQSYVATFAATGSPGDGGIGLAWPPYEASTRLTVNYETSENGGVTVLERWRERECDWWQNGPGFSVW
jgi:carboxylesterase type B